MPGKAWQVPGMQNKLLLIGLETIKSEKTGVFGQKRGRFGLSEAQKWTKIGLGWSELTKNHSYTVPGYLI